VILRGDQLWLALDRDAMALLIPTPLATDVTELLTRRRCPAPALAHPHTPDHQVLLAGERYGVALPMAARRPPDHRHRAAAALCDLPRTADLDRPARSGHPQTLPGDRRRHRAPGRARTPDDWTGPLLTVGRISSRWCLLWTRRCR
jgi:hypothetical protein